MSCKAIVTISTIKGYANGLYKAGLNFNQFTQTLQKIEECNFGNESISWLVTPGKAVYKIEWGAPKGGEDVFVLEADYTEYDKNLSIDEWKRKVYFHAEFLKCYFEQETVRVTFIDNTETIIIK